MNTLDDKLRPALEERKREHLYRSRRITDSPQSVDMIIDGRKTISFCSNDYLGLANHADVKQAFKDGVDRYGAGSGAAHLINGHSRAHHELEETLAEFTGYPRALLFSTGYMANLAVAQSLVGRGDAVFEDRLNHASLLDGGLLSSARFIRYAHDDVAALDSKLSEREGGEKLVMSDAVFSMDGDIADIPALTSCCERNDAWLMLDDAHGFGVLGEHGNGVADANAPIYMATLGKAVGTAGAFVAGSEALIETFIQQARTYIYTTAQPPAVAHATLRSIELIRDGEQQSKLNENIAYFRRCANDADIDLTDSETAIQPIIIGASEQTVAMSERLFDQGILVTAIRPPTVAEGAARLRITLSAAHERQHIDLLIGTLAAALSQTHLA